MRHLTKRKEYMLVTEKNEGVLRAEKERETTKGKVQKEDEVELYKMERHHQFRITRPEVAGRKVVLVEEWNAK